MKAKTTNPSDEDIEKIKENYKKHYFGKQSAGDPTKTFVNSKLLTILYLKNKRSLKLYIE